MSYISIQYIRAIAALMVVFYHATVYLDRIQGFPAPYAIFGGRPGLYGVIAFFIVSGHLMATIAPKYAPATFLMHRITRIYPIYWLCVAFAILAYFKLWEITKPNADHVPDIVTMLIGRDSATDLLRLTLAPMRFPDYPLGIEWTLLFETTFYVFIFVVAYFRGLKFLPHIAVAWFVAMLAVSIRNPEMQANYTQPTLFTLPFYFINSAFILGLLGPITLNKAHPLAMLLISVGIMLITEFIPSPYAMIQICGGIFCFVMGVMGLERLGRLPQLNLMKKLGDWSYALYLVHVPVIVITYKLLPPLNQWLLLAAALVLPTVVSAVVGTIDLKLYGFLKGRLDRTDRQVQVVIATVFLVLFFEAAVWGIL